MRVDMLAIATVISGVLAFFRRVPSSTGSVIYGDE
jgi:hypothetical protein